jgi:hypothetical protein
MAQIIGLSVSGYQKIEKGIHKPQQRTMTRLLRNLPGLAAMLSNKGKKKRGRKSSRD